MLIDKSYLVEFYQYQDMNKELGAAFLKMSDSYLAVFEFEFQNCVWVQGHCRNGDGQWLFSPVPKHN